MCNYRQMMMREREYCLSANFNGMFRIFWVYLFEKENLTLGRRRKFDRRNSKLEELKDEGGDPQKVVEKNERIREI